MRQETDARVGIENLLPRSGKCHGNQPAQRQQSDQGITRFPHLDDDRGRHTQGHSGQQLVGDPEQRPQRIDSTYWILHALPQKKSPGSDHQRAGSHDRGIPTGAPQWLPDVAEGVLHHETAHSRSGIENGENKERLEHDGKVIPERHHRLSAQAVRKNMRHANRECRSAACAVEERLLAHRLSQ